MFRHKDPDLGIDALNALLVCAATHQSDATQAPQKVLAGDATILP
jgi:hypothetical protein